MSRVPNDFPVKVLRPGSRRYVNAKSRATCGTCGRSWDDAIATSYTPAPSARCPFEAFHTPAKRASARFDVNGAFVIGPGVIAAMSLDDSQMRAAHARVAFTSLPHDRMLVRPFDRAAYVAFIEELEMIASSEYDLPFSLRGACGRVAKRLRSEMPKKGGGA